MVVDEAVLDAYIDLVEAIFKQTVEDIALGIKAGRWLQTEGFEEYCDNCGANVENARKVIMVRAEQAAKKAYRAKLSKKQAKIPEDSKCRIRT